MGLKDIFAKVAFGAKKHKPEIFFGLGLAGIVTGTVLCCKETLKVPDILEEHKKQREEILKKADEKPLEYKPGKDLWKLYLKTAGRMIWNYKFGIVTEAIGLGLACKGYSEKNQQYLGASAGLAAVSTAFDEYRGRAKEKFGEEVDHQLLTGESDIEITDIPGEDEVDENGKKKKVTKKKLSVCDANSITDGYGRYITKGHPLYDEDEDYVLRAIKHIQSNCNDKKNASLTNSLCLNDIYQEMYLSKDKKGMIAGYIGPCNPIEFVLKRTNIADEFGNFQDAYWIGFKGLKKNIYDELD